MDTTTNTTEKQTTQTADDTDGPALQACDTDVYVKADTSDQFLELQCELANAKRLAKHSQGKAEMCSKNLVDTKKQLEKANNVVSIHKANIEALTTEVESLKIRLRKSDETVEKHLKEIEVPTCNGNASRDGIEAGFIKLQSKLHENELTLIRRTRELEKANESRRKVAKHTRALLLELEGKLTDNNRRITELEDQLMNRTLDLQFEKEERQRIEQEKKKILKDLSLSIQSSKQREITKRSTELLQQAKDEHKQSKNEQKLQQEIELLNKKLEGKSTEIQTLSEQLTAGNKKYAESVALEGAYKKASEQVCILRSELGLVIPSSNKEKCGEWESEMQEVIAKVCV